MQYRHYPSLYNPPDWHNYNTIPAGNVYDLAFTPDGKTLISGGSNELKIWDVANGSRIASIEGYSRWVKCVDVSADGKFVAAGGNDGVIRIWDIANYLPKKQEITQNIIVPIYFLPTNRLPQADIPEKIDKILRDLQTFFADEIQRHGFGRKTFDFKKNSDGSAKVYLFEGKTTDEYYAEDTSSKVLNEIQQHFEWSNNFYFIIVDKVDKSIEKESIENRYTLSDLESIEKGIQDMVLSIRDRIFRKRQGGDIVVRTPLNEYPKHGLAAKCGDTFGLNRDYRHPSYLMSSGRQSKHLSKSSAAWLSRSRFFNTEMTFFDDKTVIETRSPSKGKIRFKVEDTDGIYQVRLLAKPINKNHPLGFQMKIDPAQNQTEWEKSYQGRYYTLHDALTLQGEKKATVELDYPKFVDDLIELHVIDSHGNRVYVIKRIDHSGTSFLRRIFN
ncbi:WD40 repeat domain-containing protein [Candidatus Poribacteria bacterium]|nr:WD40 repeat domain-containing protein [Candidatus Poribacteria bacterium]